MPLTTGRALSRRRFCELVAATLGGPLAPAAAQEAGSRRFLADMHSHYGMFLPRLFGLDLREHMEATRTTLLAWAVTDDHRWIAPGPGGWRQVRTPQPGELWDNFRQRLATNLAKLEGWRLKLARDPQDIEAALAGEPRIVLATEAANFLEGRADRVAEAHAWGVRHMQLVHFIQSPLGDHQTAEPKHGGMTSLGREVVAACRKLGIVVDLAHGTAAFVDGALAASDAAMVWSHSWVSPQGGSWQEAPYVARSLSVESARKIASAGGAVGLWTVRVRNDPAYPVHSVKTYADEIVRMSEQVGPRHVAFGTDMEGAGPGPILSNYVDLREVADNLVRRGLSEADLHGIFIGNYARILGQAMAGARP